MTLWVWPSDCRAVLELHDHALELALYYGDGVTRAAWLCSQTGRVLRWVRTGDA